MTTSSDALSKLQELHGLQGYIIISTLRPQKPGPADVRSWVQESLNTYRWKIIGDATEQEFYAQQKYCGGAPDSLIFDYFYRATALD